MTGSCVSDFVAIILMLNTNVFFESSKPMTINKMKIANVRKTLEIAILSESIVQINVKRSSF